MTMIQTTCDNPRAKYGLAETPTLHVIILCGTASYERRATNDERRADGIALCFVRTASATADLRVSGFRAD